MYLRYIGLFLVTGLGGILSGIMWLVPNGLMAGALGMSLSAGTLWLGLKQTREGIAPTVRYAEAAGAIVGLLAGILMAAVSVLCPRTAQGEAAMFGPPKLPLWTPEVMGMLYGIVLLHCYQRRLTARRPVLSTIGRACGLCFLLKAIATFVYMRLAYPDSSGGMSLVVGAALLSLLGAIPFAFLWVLATAWLDPAWAPPEARQDYGPGFSMYSDSGALSARD